MNDTDWIRALGAGDKVIVMTRRYTGGHRMDVQFVDRTSKASVWIGYTRYRRTDGMPVGGGPSICEATPQRLEIIREIARRAELVRELEACVPSQMNTETIEAILSILRAGGRDE